MTQASASNVFIDDDANLIASPEAKQLLKRKLYIPGFEYRLAP
jgi:hypothetical protein